ncbi:MAG: ATP-binding cassette domain-containing protein [Opitutales bacterium]
MFSCEDLSVYIGSGKEPILDHAYASFEENRLHALIGPSGCGKTTLMKAMLGILPAEGRVFLRGRPVGEQPDWRGEIGFAPQFSIAQPHLTVEESIRTALDLFVADPQAKNGRFEEILSRTGLAEHRGKRVGSLSGGQLRRLGLSLELTGDPACLVCDEVTTGLDPRSEDQILEVLRGLQEQREKTFVCIIHNLAKLDLFDSVTVVHEGTVVFQGPPDALNSFFGITDPLRLYDVLNAQDPEYWREQRFKYSKEQEPDGSDAGGAGSSSEPEARGIDEAVAPKGCLSRATSGENPPARAIPPLPSFLSQVWTLLRRRLTLFVRDRGYLLLTLGITLGFPCLVVIFALDGLPEVRGMALRGERGFLEELEADMAFQVEAMQTASLVTGLIMFQVILLTLMGSNNGAREIAGERTIYEKERFSGLRPTAYATSKLLFCCALAAIQGIHMMAFVKFICGFPGPWLAQGGMLALACIAMTAVCLGMSAVFDSSEKASLLSVYLVGFQLPLSGIVLALPEAIVWLCRPFINAYWGWAGYFGSMIESRFYDAYRLQATEYIPSPEVAAFVLLLHTVVGAGIVFLGCQRRGWK